MNQRQVRNLTASIRDRLRIQARERNEEFPGLPDVAALIWRFVGPAVAALRNASADTGSVFEKGWPAGGPWDDNNAD